MTVRKILELIDVINSKIGANSFSQTLQDYIVTIQNNSNNLVLLKELTDKSILDYQKLLDDNVKEMLERVLVTKVKPFTSTDFLKQLEDLKAQNNTDPATHYNGLNGILTTMLAKVNADIVELDKLRTTLEPFLSKDYSEIQKEDNAIFAIIFYNDSSFNNLKALSFELKNWDRGLFIYQQVISDETPKAFEIVEIDQGSIDVVINLIFDVCEKLLELFKIGFEVYGSYLAYKTIVFVEHIDAIQPNVDDRDFKMLAKSIRESIEKNEPEPALDRLHTFTFRYLRELCEKHKISYEKPDSLNAVFGKYIKFLVDNKHIESTMAEKILRYSINVIEAFNDIRNNKSFAHDNPVLNYHESVLIFNNVSNTIKFIETIENSLKKNKEPEQTNWNDLPF